GGHFVMDPRDAAYATKEMLRPKFAIPVHYATFPVLRGTPQEYQAALGQTTTQVFPISPGDKQTFSRREHPRSGDLGELVSADAERERDERRIRRLWDLAEQRSVVEAL